MMKQKNILVFGIACLCAHPVVAQQTIAGVVKDRREVPVSGATVSVAGDPAKKVVTGMDGSFIIEAEEGGYIEIVYGDEKSKRVWVTGPVMQITLGEQDWPLDNRATPRTSNNQTQAISTISGEALRKNSAPNPTNALYGLIPGLMVKQNTGWTANAELMVRGGGSINGRLPLVVVDGIPRDMQYLNLVDIETVSVLKDGAATAVWGTRGANGVIMVATRRGHYEQKKVNVNYRHGIGLPVNQPGFADGYTYALAKNEALHYDGLPLQYDQVALDAFQDGSQPDLFANTNWRKEALKSHSANNQLDVVFRGGGKRLRYYSAINYKNDYGILEEKVTNLSERYTSQMRKYDLNARMNLDVDITPFTKASLSMYGLLREENRPNATESNIFTALYHVPSAAFPVRTTTGAWGGNYMFKMNPVAQIADAGYFKTDRRMLLADIRLYQDLSQAVKGLRVELGVAYDNDSVYRETGSKTYAYEVTTPVQLPAVGEYEAVRETFGDNSALSIDNRGLNRQFIRTVLDGKAAYDRAFGLHAVTATLQYHQETYEPLGRNTTRKRQSFLLTGAYGYAGKYLLDIVVNRSGTSVLSGGGRYRTYPAVSAAWVLSDEPFMQASFPDHMKIRASWGRAGNDNIGYDLDERYWISSGGAQFQNPPVGSAGLIAGTLPITNLTIEMADKYNVGVDIQLLKKLAFTADAFLDKRKNSLIDSKNLFSAVIGTGIPQQNIGRMESKGFDLSLQWDEAVNKDFSYYLGGTFSYLKTKVIENGEGYQPYGYLSKKGKPYGQCYGLEAIGYFSDETDISNSPEQLFSEVRPGDIKYKDQNNDGRIDEHDVVAIGYSTLVPGIYYGINLGFEYKGFGIDMLFQGVGQFSRMLNTQSVYWPLRNNNSNISTWYLEDKVRWTEETKDIANVPRLTTLNNPNNFRSSTQWLEDGSFLKLRNVNIRYNLPRKWANAMKMSQCQVYVRGNNLFSLDHVKYMNCEDLSINYPDMASIYFGVNINF